MQILVRMVSLSLVLLTCDVLAQENVLIDEVQANADDRTQGQKRLAAVNLAAEQYLKSLKLSGSYSLQYELSEEGVTIKGELPAGTEKQALLYHVRRQVDIPVFEQIAVRSWPSDEDLKKRLKSELGLKQGLDLSDINISVSNGVVTLSGKRANHQQVDQIVSAVLMVEGVRDVKSLISYAAK